MKTVLRVLALLAIIILEEGCGTSLCNANNCQGCCDQDGMCQVGVIPNQCGARGASCTACTGDNVCSAGKCTTTSNVTVCSTHDSCPNTICTCGDGTPVNSRSCYNNRCLTREEGCPGACTALGHPEPNSRRDDSFVGPGCVPGTSTYCTGSNLEWTGALCCVKSAYEQCVPGTSTYCSGLDFKWTGQQCCITAKYAQCVPGTSTYCTGTDFKWTGSECCVTEAYSSCVAGTSTYCTGSNKRWTGAQCCLR